MVLLGRLGERQADLVDLREMVGEHLLDAALLHRCCGLFHCCMSLRLRACMASNFPDAGGLTSLGVSHSCEATLRPLDAYCLPPYDNGPLLIPSTLISPHV